MKHAAITMHELSEIVGGVADWLTLHLTIWILVGVGLFLTIVSRGVQIRHFGHMVKAVLTSRAGAAGGISSFQAFTISLAARVGIGNVFGVAAALMFGGPGAIFWMWIVALVGMATAFFEATLAQIFKIKAEDGTFRGGPAYYIRYGMGRKTLATVFALITVVTCAFAITSVQANAIASTLESAAPRSTMIVAALLVAFTGPIIFGGIRSVAKVTEIVAPVMATFYVIVVAIIILLNLSEFFSVLGLIFQSAFAPTPLVSGLGGGVFAALVNGTKRGLFSNEAGQGTAPNAAATATVAHPVQQGMVQSLGVFVDTIIVCTATAIVILLSGPEVWGQDGVNPANLTTLAVVHHLGQWAAFPMALMIFVLAFSSIIAAYVYSEVNMSFITTHPVAKLSVRIVSIVSVGLGAVASLELVWNSVDIAMAVMTISNLVALVALYKWGTGALRDFESQKHNNYRFSIVNNPHLPRDIPKSVWNQT